MAPFWAPCGPFGIPFGPLWAPLGHPWGSQWLPLGVHLDDLGVPLAKKVQISKKVRKSEFEDPPAEPKILQKSMLKPRGSKGRPKRLKARGKGTDKVRICDACAVQMTSHGKHNFPRKLQISSKSSPFWLPFWTPFWIQKKHEKKGTL